MFGIPARPCRRSTILCDQERIPRSSLAVKQPSRSVMYQSLCQGRKGMGYLLARLSLGKPKPGGDTLCCSLRPPRKARGKAHPPLLHPGSVHPQGEPGSSAHPRRTGEPGNGEPRGQTVGRSRGRLPQTASQGPIHGPGPRWGGPKAQNGYGCKEARHPGRLGNPPGRKTGNHRLLPGRGESPRPPGKPSCPISTAGDSKT